ncbi:thiol reductant ABC exporter subunit CydD [Pontibacillus sp. ALD_SL1]|uniref:thiol reductant ABC exporter subunit CydD n=1 Tax=Pontibacillus sp. ALD_SL1 TaxID=2777185 RepID=UPI001A95E0C0|nr:thiol reductant ABC exporter subunit CydD [Pontibacillus sp. ALD_SL1]QSS98738.1 thiol reductant ABC exporter subunit CydD [Pontibacillus sp. ALD_SL1]
MGKDLFHYVGMKTILTWLMVVTVGQGVAIILQASWLAEIVAGLFHQKSFPEMNDTVLLFALAFLLRYALQHGKQKLMQQYAMRATASLREEVLTNLFHLGPRVSKRLGTGNVVTLLLDGVRQSRNYLELFVPKLVNMAVLPAMIAIYIFINDYTSAIIVIVTVPILIGFMILLGYAAQRKADKQWEVYRVLSNHYVDSLRGLETLKYLGLSREHTNRVERVSERYRTSTMSTLRVAFLSSFAMDFFTMLAVATVAVFLGLRLVEGEMVLEPALTILILAPEYFLPIREIGSDYHATLNGQEAGRKLRDIASMERFSTEEHKSIGQWTVSSVLSLEHIHVRHEEAEKGLHDLTLNVYGHKKIGIVGESGAGKSTLIDLLGGFLPSTSGEISLGGQTVTHLQHEDWQRQLYYIPQHPYLFQGTIGENIAFYTPESTEEEIECAAERAGLLGWIKELPNGIHELIGDGGRGISGGQAQRIALARAFLKERPILLLDEPTAHLDIETEYALKEKMEPLFEGKLVFLATHRLHWMASMDYIYYLYDGKVVEEGTHESLMARKGYYYSMVQTQMGELA